MTPYNKKMKASLFVAVGIALVLSGCSAKRSHVARNTGSAISDAEESNPILFEEEYEASERGELPAFDIPVVRNEKVEVWLDYFQGRGRKWFDLWLARSTRYVPFMRKILREHELPEDLVNLAMIESGFSSRAYSRARAVGPWQFMKATGRLYGLKVNFWVDERRDPEKSTIAAARHLKDLYDQFQSWKLAAAAYNAGPGKVARAIKKYKTEDFWELTKGKYLRPETRQYVPKMIAAALIAKEPHKYGFVGIEYEPPLEYDKVILKFPVNLMILSEKLRIPLEDLMTINPELNHPMTPPGVESYELRVPSGKSDAFIEALNDFTVDEKTSFTAHRVHRGENLKKISALYNVPSHEILKANQVSAAEIREGRDLLIPKQVDEKLIALGLRAYNDNDRRGRRRVRRKESLKSVYSSSAAEPSVKKKSI